MQYFCRQNKIKLTTNTILLYMTKQLLLSLLMLFVGVSIQAQSSVSDNQMDERFDNKEQKLPYGWFTEGWVVKDSVI